MKKRKKKTEKIKIIKLSPELGDGDHVSVVNTTEEVLEAVKNWLENFKDEPGESCSITIEEMSKKDFDELPDL